jgi:hypothetical protein
MIIWRFAFAKLIIHFIYPTKINKKIEKKLKK